MSGKTKVSLRLSLIAVVLIAALLGCETTTPTQQQAGVSTSTQVIPSQPTDTVQVTLQATSTDTVQSPSPTIILASTTQPSSTTAPLPTNTATLQPTTTSSNPLKVYYFDVGQGDSILVHAPDGMNMLIDGGEPDTGIVQYLQGLNIQRIDVMVATHPHSDHIGGLVQVLKAIPVTKVVTNGQPNTTSIYEHFLDAIASAKAEYVEAKRGDTITLGSLSFAVLNPTATTGDMNHNSLVLRLVYGQVSFLFMGDADKDAEASIMSAGLTLQADILKVGHHGSRYSSSPAFLVQVKPAVAIYSSGVGNSYGHPHAETIAALTAVGAKIYGTDQNGTIIVTTDGIKYDVSANKGGPRAPPAVLPTAAATPANTIQPTLPATQESTIAPTSQSTQGSLSLAITSVTSPVVHGTKAILTAQTAPGANCTITIYYKSGPSHATGLEPKTADGGGNVSWTWTVGNQTTPGTWRIVVTATLNGQTITQETTFETT